MHDTLPKRQFFLNHQKIEVLFSQNKDDFVVTEVPLYPFSNAGEHLIVTFRKKDLTTWDALRIFSDHLGVKNRDIGYAGLKDKNAMTIQTISMPKTFESKLATFEHPNIKILQTTYHNNKIKIGHLKGNKFFIRFKKVLPMHYTQLRSVLEQIHHYGMPNYFGFQRFGNDGDNFLKAKAILSKTLRVGDNKLRQMYLNAYQSFRFNEWLAKRIEMNKVFNAFNPKEVAQILGIDIQSIKLIQKQEHIFKILPGELMHHYPYGKIFIAEDLLQESEKFFKRDRVPTGILCGKKVKTSESLAWEIEQQFQEEISRDGARRFAWVFPEDLTYNYKESDAHFEFSFYLPKGSYATVLIEELLH